MIGGGICGWSGSDALPKKKGRAIDRRGANCRRWLVDVSEDMKIHAICKLEVCLYHLDRSHVEQHEGPARICLRMA